jgi:hypothetical protein
MTKFRLEQATGMGCKTHFPPVHHAGVCTASNTSVLRVWPSLWSDHSPDYLQLLADTLSKHIKKGWWLKW